MLSVKQGGTKYHFLSFWYDSTWGWTLVSPNIGEHSTHLANGPVKQEVLYLRKGCLVIQGAVEKRMMSLELTSCDICLNQLYTELGLQFSLAIAAGLDEYS